MALFEQARNDETPAIEALKLIAGQIRSKVLRRGTDAGTIFASKEISKQFGLAFFKRSILVRDRSKSAERSKGEESSSAVVLDVQESSAVGEVSAPGPSSAPVSSASQVLLVEGSLPPAHLDPSPVVTDQVPAANQDALGLAVDEILSRVWLLSLVKWFSGKL